MNQYINLRIKLMQKTTRNSKYY